MGIASCTCSNYALNIGKFTTNSEKHFKSQNFCTTLAWGCSFSFRLRPICLFVYFFILFFAATVLPQTEECAVIYFLILSLHSLSFYSLLFFGNDWNCTQNFAYGGWCEGVVAHCRAFLIFLTLILIFLRYIEKWIL